MKISHSIALILILVYALPVFAAEHATNKNDEIENCESLKLEASHFSEWKKKNDLLMFFFKGTHPTNYRIVVYIKNEANCRPLLYSWAAKAKFTEKKESDYPDIETEWFYDSNKNQTVFSWNGKKYVSNELQKTYPSNNDALALFKRGNTKEAIAIWEKSLGIAKIPDYGITGNAEILNNLGFAYFKLAEETGNNKYLDEAEKYLLYARATDEDRWLVYLNLGDVYARKGEIISALREYETLLKHNPDYKEAKKIREKMAKLRKKDLIEETVIFKVNPKLPTYKLRLSIFNNEHSLYRIDVSRGNNPRVIQTLNFLEKEGKDCESARRSTEYSQNITEDINFDGYNDLKILCTWGGAGRESYLYWLFDKEKGKFNFDSSVEFSEPSLDTKKKEIIEYENWGHAGVLHIIRYYKLINNTFIIFREVDQTEHEFKEEDQQTYYHRVVTELKDGKMVEVSDKWIPDNAIGEEPDH